MEERPEIKNSNCPNCNKAITEDALFCEYCGTKIVAESEETVEKGTLAGAKKHLDKHGIIAITIIAIVVVATIIFLFFGRGIVGKYNCSQLSFLSSNEFFDCSSIRAKVGFDNKIIIYHESDDGNVVDFSGKLNRVKKNKDSKSETEKNEELEKNSSSKSKLYETYFTYVADDSYKEKLHAYVSYNAEDKELDIIMEQAAGYSMFYIFDKANKGD